MTALLHSAIPATIIYKTTHNIPLSIVAGALGALPDAINNKYYTLMPKVPRLYNKLHRPWLWLKGWKLWLVFTLYVTFAPLGLHVAMDYDFHTDDDNIRRLELMVFIEVVCWLMLLCWWFGL